MKPALTAARLLLVAALAGALPADEPPVLVSETFGGPSTSGLGGRTPAVNLLSPGAAWSADAIIAADGQINDGANTDRGACLDLGPDFAFVPNQTYKLTLSWSGLDNAILFAGFANTLPDVGAQMQTQGVNFALRARRISAGTDTLAAWKNPGASAISGTTVTAAAATATLTLETKGLSDAAFTVDGLASPAAIDLTAGFRYLWIAFEDPAAASPASDARFTALTLRGPPPADPPTVTILPESPLISAGQTVTLTSNPPGAAIHYTLDGSTPGAASTPYTGPFPLNVSATVRAVASKGGITGPVASRGFVLREPLGMPNLLLVIGPGTGYGDLQCYGGVNIATPALDSLAYDGIRFTQFTTAGPGSMAGQYALLTGRVAARSGLGAAVAAAAAGWKSEEWTLAESLRRRGYETAFVGEWLLGNAAGGHPNDQGFRLFHGLPFASSMNPPLEENRRIVETAPDPALLLEKLADCASDFIAGSAQPFALVFQPPVLPASGSSLAGPHGNRIEALDQSMGTLLAALEARGIADRTLVVFASDGGAPRTADGGSNGLLRDGAGTTWEGGMRGPLIARLPGTLPAGQMNLSLIWQPDLMPTLASLLGCDLAPDRPLDGTPRPEVLKGDRTRPAGDETAMGFRFENNMWRLATIREGKWKSHLSIVNIDPLNTNATTGSQLYDLHADAEERLNRAAAQPAALARLQALADAFAATLPAAGNTDLPAPKPAVIGAVGTTLDPAPAVSFALTRPADSTDDFYQIEHSVDLGAWQRLPVTPFIISRTALPGYSEALEIRVPFGVPPFVGERRFIRLGAERPASP